MLYLNLDESGDLGNPQESPGASRYFIITVLKIADLKTLKSIKKAVVRTLKYKQGGKPAKRRDPTAELKGAKTVLSVKQYFYRQVKALPFNLYTVILNKERLADQLRLNQSRVYNFVTYLTLRAMPLEQETIRAILTIDRSKSKSEIREFDQYLLNQLGSLIPPQVPLIINHNYSHENELLQAVDLFSWGIYRKYETADYQWYDVFREKIAYEALYPPQNKKRANPEQ